MEITVGGTGSEVTVPYHAGVFLSSDGFVADYTAKGYCCPPQIFCWVLCHSTAETSERSSLVWPYILQVHSLQQLPFESQAHWLTLLFSPLCPLSLSFFLEAVLASHTPALSRSFSTDLYWQGHATYCSLLPCFWSKWEASDLGIISKCTNLQGSIALMPWYTFNDNHPTSCNPNVHLQVLLLQTVQPLVNPWKSLLFVSLLSSWQDKAPLSSLSDWIHLNDHFSFFDFKIIQCSISDHSSDTILPHSVRAVFSSLSSE